MKLTENFIETKTDGVSGLYTWGNCNYELKNNWKTDNSSPCISYTMTKEELEEHLNKLYKNKKKYSVSK